MKKKLLFWVPNVLLVLFMVASAVYYFVDTPAVIVFYEQLGYPSYTLYFNAIAKFIGAVAILAPVSKAAKEWAYAGYLFIMLLALQAIWLTQPGTPWIFAAFLGLWAWAYYAFKKA